VAFSDWYEIPDLVYGLRKALPLKKRKIEKDQNTIIDSKTPSFLKDPNKKAM
jgi:hypothetical protein